MRSKQKRKEKVLRFLADFSFFNFSNWFRKPGGPPAGRIGGAPLESLACLHLGPRIQTEVLVLCRVLINAQIATPLVAEFVQKSAGLSKKCSLDRGTLQEPRWWPVDHRGVDNEIEAARVRSGSGTIIGR